MSCSLFQGELCCTSCQGKAWTQVCICYESERSKAYIPFAFFGSVCIGGIENQKKWIKQSTLLQGPSVKFNSFFHKTRMLVFLIPPTFFHETWQPFPMPLPPPQESKTQAEAVRLVCLHSLLLGVPLGDSRTKCSLGCAHAS